MLYDWNICIHIFIQINILFTVHKYTQMTNESTNSQALAFFDSLQLPDTPVFI